MLPLIDMLANAQNGHGMEQLAKQFGLSQQQAQSAVEALMPAFSQGLKRNASDPYGVGSFISALASGQHAKYFEDASKAFSPQGVQEGNGILGHLFGSKDLSRAVAAQASQATGLGQQTLQQMLPVIASMVMGGLFKQSTNQMQSAGGFGGNNPLGQIIEEMMKQSGGMSGGQAAPQQRQTPQSQNPLDQFGDSPWGKILQDMLGGQMGGQAETRRQSAPQQRRAPQPESRQNSGERPRNPYDDIFGQMFETGRQQRDDYEKNVGSIFDQFLRGMDRR